MKVYILFLNVPSEYSYDGTEPEIRSIHKSHETASETGKEAVKGFAPGSDVTWEVEEFELED